MAKNNTNGFTLVEVVVALSLFTVIIIITGSSFSKILSQSSTLQRSEESNIEGLVGLEMLRHDLQQAGLGLFMEPPPITYSEASVLPASTNNDAPNHVPRPIIGNDNMVTGTVGDISDEGSLVYNVLNLTDYLSIKATTVGTTKTSQKWSYILPVAGGAAPKTWPSNAENFTDSKERFVVLRRSFSNPPTATVERNTSDNTLWFKINTPAFDVYTSQGSAIFNAYGFHDFGSANADESKIRFPFNRTDYFVARPQSAAKVPPVCAPNTGILYKTMVNHADGKLTYMPILDCVAEMQVVLGWDMDNNGSVDTWSNADGSAVSGPGDAAAAISQTNNDDITAANIRNRLKVVKVYILAQDGRKDLTYASPAEITIGDDGEKSLIHNTGTHATRAAYAVPDSMRNYRWKEYRVIVRPKNLTTNQ